MPAWMVEKRIRDTRKQVTDEAVEFALVLFFSVVLDKGYVSEDDILRLWEDFNARADDVRSGRVKLHEWREVLRKEYGIGMKIPGGKEG